MNKVQLIRDEFPKQFRLRYEELGGSEGLVEHTIYGGKPTHCRSTLWTLVKILKPKSILEIGSWIYHGSNMMARSLDENFGKKYACDVHTFDIIKGGYSQHSDEITKVHSRVKPMFWYPHHTSYDSWKYQQPIEYPLFKEMDNRQIFEVNCGIIEDIMPNGGYDLIIIDGDHSIEGVKFDWEYACRYQSTYGIIVIDDLYDDRHWQVRQFWDSLVHTEKYDFSDWNKTNPDKLVSMGVI